jgi:hypothetical protein
MAEMDCGECGQRVETTTRHTFVDCSIYAVEHYPWPSRYALTLAAEVRSLRSEAEAARRLREAALPVKTLTSICPWCGSEEAPETADEEALAGVRNPHLSPLMCPECRGVGGYDDWGVIVPWNVAAALRAALEADSPGGRKNRDSTGASDV